MPDQVCEIYLFIKFFSEGPHYKIRFYKFYSAVLTLMNCIFLRLSAQDTMC